MTYRDELEAALQRAQQSEQELARERAQSMQKDQHIYWLQQQLAEAQKGLAVIPSPAAIGNATAMVNPLARGVQRFLWALAAFAVLAIGAASIESESKGVALAQVLGAFPFAAIAGQLTLARPLKRYFASVALGFIGGGGLILFFFASIWRSL